MAIRWIQAVIDLPAEQFELGGHFWADRTQSVMADPHPDHPEFVHLVPNSGDMYLELQRIDQGAVGIHIDLLVEDIPAETARAMTLGANLVAKPGHAVLTSPGDIPFCLVPYSGESQRAPLLDPEDLPSAVDQVSIDVPHALFEAEVAFWAAFSGWEPNEQVMPEFCSFDQPGTLPLRLLIHRLGNDHEGPGRAHLDLAAGVNIDSIARRHQDTGGTMVKRFEYWTVMKDPAGMPYCITHRKPRPLTS